MPKRRESAVAGTRSGPRRSRTPRKAPNGQGGVGQTADGRWWARLTAEVDGKKRRLVAYAKDEAGARLALEELRTRRHRNELVAPDTLTVAKATEQYIALKVAGGLGSQTANGYRLTLTKYLAPALGSVRVQALTAARIQSHYLFLLTEGRSRPNAGRKAPDGSPQAGLSANTVLHVHRLLSPALELARRNKVITTNPARDVVLPRLGDKPVAAVLDREQLGVLAAGAVADEHWGASWLLLVETGARLSELLGPAWKHVDLKARSITIAGSLNRHNRALATT
ncbi:MAG TPA: hypothetical protein VNK05_10445 [Chloroflexota bacterium]|jgi:integrase|nr:hypothetical protein [Chloroflexota bacterium]